MNINDIIAESIENYLNRELFPLDEAHVAIVDHVKQCAQLVADSWQSPDDVWWVKIDQRKKDAIKFNQRHGFTAANGYGRKKRIGLNPSLRDKQNGIMANGFYFEPLHHKEKRHPFRYKGIGIDSTGRENHVGHVLVRGRTKEDAVRSLLNPTVYLDPFFADIMGKRYITSNDNDCGAIKEVCDTFFARAYITINKRSVKDSIKRARDMANPRSPEFRPDFRREGPIGPDGKPTVHVRYFHHAIGKALHGMEGGIDRMKERPLCLVDCDIDNEKCQQEVRNYFKSKNIPIKAIDTESHDGWHFVVDPNGVPIKEIQKMLNKITNRHLQFNQNKAGDNPIQIEHDYSEILYSPIGQ